MTVETKLGPKIILDIPAHYYRKLDMLKYASYNRRNMIGGPISDENVYYHFRTLMERLMIWLSDQTSEFGYRTSAFTVIGWTDKKVELQATDNPCDFYWTNEILNHLSDLYGFGVLLDRWQNEP